MIGDVGKGFVDNYLNFQEEENNESFCVEEESMPVYDTDIEDVIEEEEGFVEKWRICLEPCLAPRKLEFLGGSGLRFIWTSLCIGEFSYGNHPRAFTLKINHGGTLTSPSNVRYRGGKANWFDDVDEILFLLLKCKQCCDKDVMEMCHYVSQCKVMDVFVIHPISEPELVSNEDIDNEFDHLFSYPDNNTYKDRPSGSNAGKSPSGSNAGKRPSVIEDVDGSDSSAASEDSEDSDDSEFDVGDEDRIEDVEVDMDDFRKHTDENVEWVECNEEEVQVPPPFDYEEVDLEDFGSGTESDDLECARKGALKKLAKAHRPVDGQMYTENFYVGQSLANKQLIKEMVSKLYVAQRRQLWFTRNDKTRMRAECRGFVPIFRKVQFEHEHVVMNPTSAGMRHHHLHLYIQRISLTGFPAQSVGSSNTDVLDLPCLLVLITGTSQSRQHVDTSLIHIESRKSPTAVLFDDDTGRISIRHCEY
ncbi:hypothetical protein Tco_1419390 [Tanacetum coccineum]